LGEGAEGGCNWRYLIEGNEEMDNMKTKFINEEIWLLTINGAFCNPAE